LRTVTGSGSSIEGPSQKMKSGGGSIKTQKEERKQRRVKALGAGET